MQSFVVTIAHRPYVFIFFVAFFVIGILNRGLGRTLLFLFLGYTIAFLSEFSSIRCGLPYGIYRYVYENLRGEILVGGVPVWDSLSYVFIAYASYEMAGSVWRFRGGVTPPLLAALLMTLLDIVIDPLAVRGDRWFLGKIFYYPNGGIYFGVPLSNFAGWFLVAFLIFSGYQFLELRLCRSRPPQRALILGPLFYGGILLFNLFLTLWIREFVLVATGLGLYLLTTGIFLIRRTR